MKIKRYIILIACFIICFGIAANPSISAGGGEFKITEDSLPNGLKVIVAENHSVPILAAYLCFRTGSVNETPGTTGVSHLLEHLMFKGTDIIGTKNYEEEKPVLDRLDHLWVQLDDEHGRPELQRDNAKIGRLQKEIELLNEKENQLIIREELTRIYERNGGANLNGMTSKDGTYYLCSLPANRLELWALIQSEQLLHPVFREFYQERSVVVNEQNLSEDDPYSAMGDILYSTAFEAHSYRTPIGGWKSDIERIGKKAVEEHFSKFYAPNNAFIVIVGDVTFENAMAVVKKYFGRIPKGPEPPAVTTVEPRQKGEKRMEAAFDVEPYLLIGYHKPEYAGEDQIALEVISELLTGGDTSMLVGKLVQEKTMCADVFSDSGALKFPDLFVISASVMPDSTIQDVEDAIYEEIEKLKNEPVSATELKKVKERLTAGFKMSFRTNEGIADMLSGFEFNSTWRFVNQYEQKLSEVTPGLIQQVARKYFVKENRTVVFTSN